MSLPRKITALAALAALAVILAGPDPVVLFAGAAASFAAAASTAGLLFTRAALRDERAHSAALLAWIEQHQLGTEYQPYEGDEAER